MNRSPFIILHKSEWNRLQRQGGPPPEEPVNTKEEYVKAITEQSQEIMKTWPDSIAGLKAKIEKQKKNQEKANMEFIKSYRESDKTAKQEHSKQSIKEAKQLIFERSNYGRKLLSSLLESKAIEEREAQIRFNKEVQRQAEELEIRIPKKEGLNFYEKDAEREKQRKLNTLQCIEVNKEIVLLKKEKELQDKLIEKQCAVDEELIKQVIEMEEMEKEDIKRCEKQRLEEYEADTKVLKTIKEQDQKLNDALIDVHKREQDRIKMRTKAVLRKVHLGRPDTKWSKDLYEKIKHLQAEENKRFESFVDKGVKAYEQREAKKYAADTLGKKQQISNRYLISQRNKIAGEEIMLAKICENKRSCDKQSLPLKVTAKHVTSKDTKSRDHSTEKQPEKIYDKKVEKLSFLVPRNVLIEELKKREKEPSPWNAAEGAHAHFAQEADNILKEIKHKNLARKVVDEYRDLNCLDATTLPVPNY